MQWCCTAVGFAAVQPSETEWGFFFFFFFFFFFSFFFSVRWAQEEGCDYGADVQGGWGLGPVLERAREFALGKLRPRMLGRVRKELGCVAGGEGGGVQLFLAQVWERLYRGATE